MVKVAAKVLKSGDFDIDEVLVACPASGEIARIKKEAPRHRWTVPR